MEWRSTANRIWSSGKQCAERLVDCRTGGGEPVHRPNGDSSRREQTKRVKPREMSWSVQLHAAHALLGGMLGLKVENTLSIGSSIAFVGVNPLANYDCDYSRRIAAQNWHSGC